MVRLAAGDVEPNSRHSVVEPAPSRSWLGTELRNFPLAPSVKTCVAMQMGSSKTAAAINMTPMIDILLVLLIICMVLLDHSKGLPSEVPQPAPADTQPSSVDALDLTLRIKGDHSIDINAQPVLTPDLETRLKTLFASRPGGVLFIDGAPELEYNDVASVIDIARGAGVLRIGIITERERP